MRSRKPPLIGTIGVTRATLFDKKGRKIAYCLDTPNAIAKALVRVPEATKVKGIIGTFSREHYKDRMKPEQLRWNKAQSGLQRIK